MTDKTRDAKAAALIQAQLRGRSTRKIGIGKEAAAAASAAGAAAVGGKKAKEAAKHASEAASRQRLAETTFLEADEDGSGYVDEQELTTLLATLLTKQGIAYEKSSLAEFVNKEFHLADADGDGQVDFDEFVAYYNAIIERFEKNQLSKEMESAATAAKRKEEERSMQEDEATYEMLATLLAIFRSPSVVRYSGVNIPWSSCRESKSDGSAVMPEPLWGYTSRGLVLDLSRQSQRIITPWGGLSFGYRLAFPGYQDKVPAADAVHITTTPWPHVAAADSASEEHPLFFELCKYKRPLLALSKIANRCHFRVTEINGRSVPKGEVVTPPHDDMQKRTRLQERYHSLLKRFSTDPSHGLQDEPTGMPLINELMGRHIATREDKIDAVKKRKEIAGSRSKFLDEDVERALLLGENDIEKAVKLLQAMKRSEDNLVQKRQGHATRAQVRYALQTCSYDEEEAEFMLLNEKDMARDVSFITGRLGTMSGLGYPTTAEIQLLLVKNQGHEGSVMAALKKKNRVDVEMMKDILAAAEVDEMLTPDRCDAFGFSRHPSMEDQKHLEDLYLHKFNRDKDRVVHYFAQAGSVIKRAAVQPKRKEVEALLDEFNCDAEIVLKFLDAVKNMMDVAHKNGSPRREDCIRYLRACMCDEDTAMRFMQAVHKLSNPNPPKQPKGSKKPPAPHLAAACGFPSRAEAEWALKSQFRKPIADENEKSQEKLKINLDKAVELLTRLNQFDEDRKSNPEKFGPLVSRQDIVWALDPARTDHLLKVHPLSHEEYTQGVSPTSILIHQIAALLARFQDIEGGDAASRSVTDETRQEVWGAIEKFEFNEELASNYITGMRTLMLRKVELEIESREEVEQVMKNQKYDDKRVLSLMQDIAAVNKKRAEIGNPSREEIKRMLLEAWEDPNRVAIASASLKTYRELLQEDGQMLMLFGAQPNEADRQFILRSSYRFKGIKSEVEGYMKKVSDLVHQGEALGNPTREQVVEVLDEFNLSVREAQRKLRDEHWKIKDAELKEEYRRNLRSSQADPTSP